MIASMTRMFLWCVAGVMFGVVVTGFMFCN